MVGLITLLLLILLPVKVNKIPEMGSMYYCFKTLVHLYAYIQKCHRHHTSLKVFMSLLCKAKLLLGFFYVQKLIHPASRFTTIDLPIFKISGISHDFILTTQDCAVLTY